MNPHNEFDHHTPLCTQAFYSGTFYNKVNICATKMDCIHTVKQFEQANKTYKLYSKQRE